MPDAPAPNLPAVSPQKVAGRKENSQLATEVLIQYRQGGEHAGGSAKPWGSIVTLLHACSGIERNELMLRTLQVAAPIGDTAAQMTRGIVEDDVQRAQVPSLLASANGLLAPLVNATLRLSKHPVMATELQ